MRATQAARHAAGTILRCAVCGTVLRCTGHELTALCTNGGRHRATQMRPCEDAESRDTHTTRR